MPVDSILLGASALPRRRIHMHAPSLPQSSPPNNVESGGEDRKGEEEVTLVFSRVVYTTRLEKTSGSYSPPHTRLTLHPEVKKQEVNRVVLSPGA